MSNFDKNCIETQIQTNIDNTNQFCDAQDIAKTGLAASCVSNDRKFSVATGNDLPDLQNNTDIPNGTIVFVEEIGIPLVKSNLKWLGMDGRVYRDDETLGEIYALGGLNIRGELGDGDFINRSSPVQEVSSSTDWTQVSGGSNYSLALKKSGEIYGWGGNAFGERGDGTATLARPSPVQEASSSTDWCEVRAISRHSLALKTDGTIWAWGFNNVGQLGNPNLIEYSSPVQEVSSSTDWCQVDGGFCHSLALKTSGTLWGWGSNRFGVLGESQSGSLPVQEVSSSTNWCQVSAGEFNSYALKTSGTLWAWGDNNCGKIGDGTEILRSSPVQEVTSSTDWCQVCGATRYVFALKTNGTLWGWGYNLQGDLGDGTVVCRSSPVQEISSSTNWCQIGGRGLALKTSGTLWGWGSNFCGRLGDGTTICRSSPVQEVSSSTDWGQVAGIAAHALAIKKL